MITLKTASFYTQVDATDITASVRSGLTRCPPRSSSPIDDFAEYHPCPFWLLFRCVLLAPQTVSSLLKALLTMGIIWLSYRRRRRRKKKRSIE
jgi:hypothetical protein